MTGHAIGLLATVGWLLTAPLPAEPTPGVYVILDGSGSMWGQLTDGTHKITAAREVLAQFRADDYAGRELAFRVYGHRRKGDCSDSELVVPFAAPEQAIADMATFAEQVNPTGKTPISRSLRAALEDFGDRPGEIVLISDGIETCDEDPCALVRAWREKNVDIRVHVVGLGLRDEEQAAMVCIAEAAGTTYQDAQSVDELMAGLENIQDAAATPRAATSDWRVLSISATNAAGEPMRVHGTAQHADHATINVHSLSNHRVPVGENVVTVGVRTRNGNLYQPVTKTVDVAAHGATEVTFVVPEPPSVGVRFVENGKTVDGVNPRVDQDGKEIFSFHWADRAYLDPGTYAFRATPNADNELEVTETFADGDHKEVVFELVTTVQASFEVVAAGTGESFGTGYELWQDGERAYKVHRVNGVRARPGTYELRLADDMRPFVQPDVVLTEAPDQSFRFEVPVGHVTFRYLHADGSPDKDARVFLTREGAASNGRGRYTRGGEAIPLMPGRYFVEAWKQMGTYDRVDFVVEAGVDQEVSLRRKGE